MSLSRAALLVEQAQGLLLGVDVIRGRVELALEHRHHLVAVGDLDEHLVEVLLGGGVLVRSGAVTGGELILASGLDEVAQAEVLEEQVFLSGRLRFRSFGLHERGLEQAVVLVERGGERPAFQAGNALLEHWTGLQGAFC